MSVSAKPKFRCDGCGKEVEDRFEWWSAQRHTHTLGGFTHGDLFSTSADFCEECWREVVQMFHFRKSKILSEGGRGD
jgi:hypothetical protein